MDRSLTCTGLVFTQTPLSIVDVILHRHQERQVLSLHGLHEDLYKPLASIKSNAH